MLGICDCFLEGRDSLSFFWSFLFVGGGGLDCGTLCVFLLLIMLEILFHDVLP